MSPHRPAIKVLVRILLLGAIFEIAADVVEEGRFLVIALVGGGFRRNDDVFVICVCTVRAGIGGVSVDGLTCGDCLFHELLLVEFRIGALEVEVFFWHLDVLLQALASSLARTGRTTSSPTTSVLSVLNSHLVDLLGQNVDSTPLSVGRAELGHGSGYSGRGSFGSIAGRRLRGWLVRLRRCLLGSSLRLWLDLDSSWTWCKRYCNPVVSPVGRLGSSGWSGGGGRGWL